MTPEQAIETLRKTCRTCGESKPLDEFFLYGHGRWRRGDCKPCYATKTQAWRQANREKVLATQRARNALYRKRHRDECADRRRRWRQENPEKYAAHTAVQRALERAVLIRPTICEDCGKRSKLNAHHEDYTQPLDVRWLCAGCHRDAHMVMEQ